MFDTLIKEMQIQTILRAHLTPVIMAIKNKKTATNAGEDARKMELLHTVGGNIN
jgi:hypothetical protein